MPSSSGVEGWKPVACFQRLDIGIGLLDVARLLRQELDLGLAPKRLLDRGDVVEQGDGAVIADIVEPVGRRRGGGVGRFGVPVGIGGRDVSRVRSTPSTASSI